MTDRELTWAYFRAPIGSDKEQDLGKQMDRRLETGKKPKPAPRIPANRTESQKNWRANNRERDNANHRAWKKKNPDKERAYQKKYIEKNRKKVNQWKQNWRKRNPEKVRQIQRNRRRRIKNARNPHTIPSDQQSD